MTPAAAQALHTRITGDGGWVMWLITRRSPRYPGMVTAWAMVADRSGGRQEGDELVADTLDEVRGMLPKGLTRSDRTAFLPKHEAETWD